MERDGAAMIDGDVTLVSQQLMKKIHRSLSAAASLASPSQQHHPSLMLL